MESVTRVQILDEAVYASFYADTLDKSRAIEYTKCISAEG